MKRKIATIVVCVLVCLAAFSVAAFTPQKSGKDASAWKHEHSGHPYVGAEIFYVIDFGPNAGHPRPATVTRAGYDNQRIDLKVYLSPKDVAEGEPTIIDVEEVAPFAGDGEINGTWRWPPDPRDYRTQGQ